MPPDPPVLKEGSFYRVVDGGDDLVLEDMTKRGLEVRETRPDGGPGVRADMGVIHGMDGTGHPVAVRWFFPKSGFGLDEVMERAGELEEKYARLRGLTCPD